MEKNYKKLCPFKGWVLENFPFIEADFDAITNYELLCKIVEYLNKTSSQFNDMIDNINYLNDWFNSLNLQDEVNNKLDEMVESGQLQEIIAEYLNANALWCFDTVEEMKEALNLIDGSFAKTLGYFEKNDGGMSTYKIRKVTNEDIIDEASIISLNDNTLVAELIPTNPLNIKVFGVKEDDSTDDSDNIQKAFDYIGNHLNIELIGNRSFAKITKTLKLKVYSKINQLWIKAYSGSYSNSYVLYVNANSILNGWQVSYPLYEGYIKNCKFTNVTDTDLNCIYNYSNSEFSDIIFNNFNKAFNSYDGYLDGYKLQRITNQEPRGSDYCIHLGYLGDQVVIDSLHLLSATNESYPNQLNIAGGHNGIILNNIIVHGVINIVGSNITINNIHQEGTKSKIVIDNSIIKLSNGFVYHNLVANEHNFDIKGGSRVIIENFKFNYNLNNLTDLSLDDVDINITSGDVDVINCYKRTLTPDIAENNLAIAKTNLGLTLNENQHYSTTNTKLLTLGANQTNVAHGLYYNASSGSRATWKLPSGTYYYKIQPVGDFGRMLGYVNNVSTISPTLTNGSNGWLLSLDPGMYRIYRGTTSGSYDKYVDICVASRSMIDDGNCIGGYLWQTRVAGDSDIFTGFSHATYNGDNITFLSSSLPSIGTWNRGDVIYNNNSSSTTKGWICIVSGTPGTWKELE